MMKQKMFKQWFDFKQWFFFISLLFCNLFYYIVNNKNNYSRSLYYIFYANNDFCIWNEISWKNCIIKIRNFILMLIFIFN